MPTKKRLWQQWLDIDLVEWLVEYAAQERTSVSQVIRTLVLKKKREEDAKHNK